MAGLKSLVGLAFFGSIGLTLLIVACAVFTAWWPFFVVIFYLAAPIPTVIVKRYIDRTGNPGGSYMDVAIFVTMGFVISAFGLPIILARAPNAVIGWQACFLTLSANAIIFLTMLGFFMIFHEEESWWQI